MLFRLLILLTLVPLVELMLLLRLAEWFQWGPTIALVIVTGVLGAYLARREGFKTLGRIEAELAAGVVPTGALVEGALIVAAGLVLVTPGILTDLVGFALLIAPIRRWTQRRLVRAFKRRLVVRHFGVQRPEEPSEFVDVAAESRDAERPAKEAERHDVIERS